MSNVLKINRARWRTGMSSPNGTGEGDTALLNKDGYMCCLGFMCRWLGIPKKDLLGNTNPYDLHFEWDIPYLLNGEYNSSFADKAITINDSTKLSPKQREEKIKKHFATEGIKVVFIGKYPNKPK